MYQDGIVLMADYIFLKIANIKIPNRKLCVGMTVKKLQSSSTRMGSSPFCLLAAFQILRSSESIQGGHGTEQGV